LEKYIIQAHFGKTMSLDVVMPKNNEVELVSRAKQLGFTHIILLYEDFSPKTLASGSLAQGIEVKTAFLAKTIGQVQSAKPKFNYCFAPLERSFVESTKVDFVISDGKDASNDLLFQKRSGMDDVLSSLAKDHKIAIAFDVSSSDARILGRFSQNAMLVKKFKLKSNVFTFAKTALDMRAPRDIEGFARTIGL
jgi:RNase P/RNase MRP subunit p30